MSQDHPTTDEESKPRQRCNCQCPDGPCEHIWDGPDETFDDGLGVSSTCSRCGCLAVSHDVRVF